MKFSEIEYKRPNVAEVTEKFDHLINLFNNAASFDEQDALMKNINDLRMEFQTNYTLASIKYSIDTNDAEFEEEQKFYDTNAPLFDGLVHKYYSAITASKFRNELEAKWGKQLFDVANKLLYFLFPLFVGLGSDENIEAIANKFVRLKNELIDILLIEAH